jgi:hypothetical protein
MPEETHVFMHFTTPKPAGKRVIPSFFGIHEHTEVCVHVRPIPGAEVIAAGMKRLSLIVEDDAAHVVKRRRLGSFWASGEHKGGEYLQAAEDMAMRGNNIMEVK